MMLIHRDGYDYVIPRKIVFTILSLIISSEKKINFDDAKKIVSQNYNILKYQYVDEIAKHKAVKRFINNENCNWLEYENRLKDEKEKQHISSR